MTLTNNLEMYVVGGSFSPPTIAHQKIISACLEQPKCGGVIVLPSGEREDKAIGLTVVHRLGLVAAMLSDIPAQKEIQVETLELKTQEATQTWRTVAQLGAKHCGINLRYVFGADSYNSMPNWEEGEAIQQLPLAIVGRDDLAIPTGPNIVPVVINAGIGVSSTEVRWRIETGQDYSCLVSPAVAQYITEQQLYT